MVALSSIACQQHARRFLIDQGGPAWEAPLSKGHLVRMAMNADVVEKAVIQFEREIVCRVRSKCSTTIKLREHDSNTYPKADSYSAQELQACYGAGARGHPPTLTRTESHRFISSYYTLWGLMKLDASEWESRLEHMTSKQLYYLHEMTKLTQSIGREEVVPKPLFPDEPPDSVHSINSGQSEKRITLGERVWQQIQDTSQRIFNQDALYPEGYAKHEGFMSFVIMWDHWQPSLKDMVLHQSTSSIRPTLDVKRRYLWNDDPEEQ